MLSNNSNGQYSNNSASDSSSRDSLDVSLSEYLVKVKRRWKPALAIFLLTLGVTGGLSLLQKKTYQAEGKLLFKSQSAVGELENVGGNAGELKTILNDQTPLSTQIQILQSEPVVSEVIDRQKLTDADGDILKVKDFRKRLVAEVVGGTDVVSVSYKHPDPEVASKVVNTLMDVYIQEQIRGNQKNPGAAEAFIQTELPGVESEVKSAEADIAKFRTENQIVDLGEEKKGLVENLGSINQQITVTGSQLQGMQAQSAALQGQLGLNLEQAVKANQLGSVPEVQSVLDQLAQTESGLATERQRFNDEHPAVVSLTEKKNALTQQLQNVIAVNVGEGVQVSQGFVAERKY